MSERSFNFYFKRTGVPHTIGVLLITLAVFNYDANLVNRSERSLVIALATSNDDMSQELASPDLERFDGLTEETKLLLSNLANAIKNQQLRAQHIVNGPFFKSIESSQHNNAIAYLSLLLKKDMAYQNLVDLLQSISTKNRIAADVQFCYAFSLSKIQSYQQAIAEYKYLLAEQPNHQAAVINMALNLAKAQQHLAALEAYQTALLQVSEQKKAKVLVAQAQSQLALAKDEDAMASYQQSIQLRPNHAATWIRYASLQARLQRPPTEVVASFQRALELAPSDLDVFSSYIYYLVSRLDFAAAYAALESREKLLVGNTPLNQLWVLISIDLDRVLKAQNLLKQIKQTRQTESEQRLSSLLSTLINKQYTQAEHLIQVSDQAKLPGLESLIIARVLLENNKLEPAITTFKQVLDEPWLGSVAKLHLSRAYRRLGKLNQSRSYLMELLSVRDVSYVVWNELSLLESAAGNQNKAIHAISQARSLAPDNSQLMMRFVALSMNTEDQDAALVELEKYLERFPQFIMGWRQLARYQIQAGQHKKAIATLQTVLGLEPNNSESQYALAQLYFQQKDYSLAVPILNNLLDYDIQHSSGRFLLAKSYCKLGQVDDCRYQIERLLKLDSDIKQAKAFLKKIPKRKS